MYERPAFVRRLLKEFSWRDLRSSLNIGHRHDHNNACSKCNFLEQAISAKRQLLLLADLLRIGFFGAHQDSDRQ
jgi:hypothetical protein